MYHQGQLSLGGKMGTGGAKGRCTASRPAACAPYSVAATTTIATHHRRPLAHLTPHHTTDPSHSWIS